jgi:hypothetical protein
MRIACLHTIGANVAVFDAAAAPLGLKVEHAVRDDLLKSAEAAGGTTPEIDRRTADALLELVSKADAVLLTCSTVGRGAELAAAEAKIPIVRVDAALAEQVVAAGGRAMVLCAAATTLEPTRRLFELAAKGARIEIDYELVPGAWALYKAGDITGYARAIAAAADAAYAAGYTTVALAQASMACAGEFATKGVPLASPAAGLAAAARARRA